MKQIGEKARDEKRRVSVGFIYLEKGYNRGNREALLQVLRMDDADGKLLSGTKGIYVDSLACVRVKGGKSERFERDGGVRQGESYPVVFSMYICTQ